MTKRILIFLFLVLIWGSRCTASDQKTAQWIVVTPPAFRESLKPLVDHRSAEGFKVVIVETTDILNAEQIQQGYSVALKEHLRRLCGDFSGPSYVLLAGAAQASEPAIAEKTVVPTLRGTVGRMNGQPSDNGYGCLGQDIMPTVAVGRFPARNAEEIRQMVQKTLKMEKDGLSGSWRNRLVMILGNPGGNTWLEKRLVNAYVQTAAAERFGRLHPLWEGRSIIHCSSSPFCVPDEALQDASLRYLQEGQFFSFYLGHSGASSFWSDGIRFMDREAWDKLKIPQGQGVFFTCGCYACQLSGMDGEGYGLVAIRNPDGPAAVIGAHAETYAAMGQLALDGMLKRFSSPPATARLADYWLTVKAGLDHGEIDAMTFQMLDQADGSRGKTPLAVQRQEHQEMWMLLGDPAMQLSFPLQDIRLEVAPSATPGERLVVKGILPDRLAGATVRVTLLRPMGSLPQSTEALPDKRSEKRSRIMAENHRRANDLVLAAEEIKSTGNAFECSLELPGEIASKKVIVQAYSATEREAAYGIAILPLLTAEKTQKNEETKK